MSVAAYFIGGSQDLTKRKVPTAQLEMYFHMVAPLTWRPGADAPPVICKERYRLVAQSETGVCVYEYAGKA